MTEELPVQEIAQASLEIERMVRRGEIPRFVPYRIEIDKDLREERVMDPRVIPYARWTASGKNARLEPSRELMQLRTPECLILLRAPESSGGDETPAAPVQKPAARPRASARKRPMPSQQSVLPAADPPIARTRPEKPENAPQKRRGNPRGQVKASNDPQGRNMSGVWSEFFFQNERAGPADRLTDEEIAKRMWELFPHNPKPNVGAARRRFNQGCFSHGAKPWPQSRRYSRRGDTTVPVSARGLELPDQP